MTFLFDRCDKSLGVVHNLLAFPTIILQLVYWVSKRTYTSQNRTEWSHFALDGTWRKGVEKKRELELWPQAVSSYHDIDNGYSRINDIPWVTVICQCQWTTNIGATGPRLQYTAKGKLAPAISRPSLSRSHGGIFCSGDVPIEFSENNVRNPELVGEWGSMEGVKKMMQSCVQVKSVLVDGNKGMRWK